MIAMSPVPGVCVVSGVCAVSPVCFMSTVVVCVGILSARTAAGVVIGVVVIGVLGPKGQQRHRGAQPPRTAV